MPWFLTRSKAQVCHPDHIFVLAYWKKKITLLLLTYTYLFVKDLFLRGALRGESGGQVIENQTLDARGPRFDTYLGNVVSLNSP